MQRRRLRITPFALIRRILRQIQASAVCRQWKALVPAANLTSPRLLLGLVQYCLAVRRVDKPKCCWSLRKAIQHIAKISAQHVRHPSLTSGLAGSQQAGPD